MTGPKGNSEFCFPKAKPRGTVRVKGKQTSLFPMGPVIRRFVVLASQLKACAMTANKIIFLTRAGTQICHGFKVHDLITCELKLQVVVSLGSN